MLLFVTPFLLALAHAAPHASTLRSRDFSSVAYFLDNNPAGNSIVSLRIGPDGRVCCPFRTSTGGFGAYSTSLTGTTDAMDTLGSQGAVAVGGNLLFTVNAGSDTVSVFRINPWDASHPILVGTTPSLGSFPVSVTYSQELGMACVLNGGAKAGVGCFAVDPNGNTRTLGPLRSLGSAINETTPPTGPPGSASEVLFNPQSSAVFAVVKGDVPSVPGSIVSFAVDNGRVSTDGVISHISDMTMDFGSVFLSDSRLFVVDPSYGASVLGISSNLEATEEAHTVITGQIANCWAAYDPALDTAYAIDAGQPVVNRLNAMTGAFEGSITAEPAALGFFDSAIANNYMYSLAASNAVVVFDLVEERQLQYLNLTSFAARQGYQGMAVWTQY